MTHKARKHIWPGVLVASFAIVASWQRSLCWQITPAEPWPTMKRTTTLRARR